MMILLDTTLNSLTRRTTEERRWHLIFRGENCLADLTQHLDLAFMRNTYARVSWTPHTLFVSHMTP